MSSCQIRRTVTATAVLILVGATGALAGDAAAGLTPAPGSPIGLGAVNQVTALSAGHMNNDGRLDLVGITFGQNVHSLLGDGAGGFAGATGSPFTSGGGVNGQDLALGDFNGDGNLDAVRAAIDITILLGNGTGALGAPGTSFPVTHPPGEVYHGLAAARVDADADLDLVAMDASNYGARVFAGDGAGAFATGDYGSARPGNEAEDVAVGDMNGDGKLDVLTANGATRDVSVLLGDGAGNLADVALPVSTGADGRAQALAVGDLTGDGRLDVVAASGSPANSVSVMRGDGAGQLTVSGSPVSTGGTSPQDVALADVNSDGRIDAVTANRDSDDLSVLIGDGAGGLAPAPYSPVAAGATRPVAVVAADFDGNGEVDVASGNDSSSISVLLSTNAPAIAQAPSPLDFGAPVLGSTARRSLVVTNAGTGFLRLGRATLGGANAGDFRLADDGCSARTVPVGASCRVVIDFGPGAIGRRGATLGLTSSAPGSPHAVALSGAGVAGPPSISRVQIRRFAMTRKRFRRARGATPTSARRRLAPRGSAFVFRLSEPATARITIQRLLPGRRQGRRCAAPRRSLRARPRCTRLRRAGVLQRRSGAKTKRVEFSGRIGRRPLAAGRYRATITAVKRGAPRAAPRKVAFTIVGEARAR